MSAELSDVENELWRPVLGYEGLYEVSNMGRVRSLDRTVWRDGAQYVRPHLVPIRGQLVRGNRQKNGYVGVCLWKDGVPQNHRVHRLVLESFTGPCPPGSESLHRNGVRHDNRLDNLRWGSHQENYEDRQRHGTAPGADGCCKRGHLLSGPNLKPRRGTVRECLACSRAVTYWNWATREGRPPGERRELWIQGRADDNYRDIMGPSDRHPRRWTPC